MTVDPVFIFDLDGVITNPEDSSIDRDAVGHIHSLLKKGSYVAVNTGRSYQWVQSHLLDLLAEMGGATAFDHLYIVCEKGGESIEWLDGKFQPLPSRFALARQTYDTAKQVYEENKDRLGTMFWDASKLTMATIEKRPEADFDQFKNEQQRLAAALRQAFEGHEVRVDATTIATDVESPAAGKHAGAELIYEWIISRTATPHKEFVSFGDSQSDYEMARYFAQKDSSSAFVFVGAKDQTFTEHPGVKLIRTDAKYAAGTNEYFRSMDW